MSLFLTKPNICSIVTLFINNIFCIFVINLFKLYYIYIERITIILMLCVA